MVNKELTNRSGELVKELRSLFFQDYESDKDEYEEADVIRLKEDDWLVKRFLLAQRRDVRAALSMLKTTLKMRKEYKVPVYKDYNFPLEFYQSGGLFVYEKDRKGNLTVYMRICLHKKISELQYYLKLYLLHVFEKADRETKGGFVVVFDMTNAGYSNVDMDFLNFLLHSANNHFPVGLKYVLVVNLHWMLNAVRKAVFAILPANLMGIIHFASGDQIFDYIDKENVPDFLGGTCRTNYMQVPKGAPLVKDLAIEHGHSKELVDKLMPIFAPLLEESKRKLATGYYVDRENYFDEPEETQEVVAVPTAAFSVQPEKAVAFIYDSSRERYTGELLIQNLSEKPLAFKVQSNLPQNYLVSPRLGIILPKSCLVLHIELIPGHEFQSKIGKFLVLGSEVNETSMKLGDFDKLWREKRNEVYSFKLRSDVVKELPKELEKNEARSEAVQPNYNYLEAKYKELQRRQNQLTVLLMIVFVLLILAVGIFLGEFYFESNASELFLKFVKPAKTYI